MGFGSGAACIGVTTQVAGGVGGPHSVSVRSVGRESGIAVCGACGCSRLREITASGSLAAFNSIAGHAFVVSGGTPTQIDRT